MRIDYHNKNNKQILDSFIYTTQKDNSIIKHEELMLKKYSDIIDEYKEPFKKYNCSLKIGHIWTNFVENKSYDSRPPFKNGYQCHIYCEVQRNGKEIHIKSTDGEVDYYALSSSWVISAIERYFFKLKVSLCSATDDIKSDIEELYKLLSKNNKEQNLIRSYREQN